MKYVSRLHQAVEELRPKPPPTTDKKTAFWNTYKVLADEHDKELLQRYSTDLDTSLIFAGLFSAVDSAFIIQIQPEFQPSDSSQLSDPPIITLVSQSLLYVSLGSTLLAALLAVLGKQWLMYYSAAGERGTIETRGLERQRKLDGLRKWRFDTIMQTFPLLLQFALFVFAAALSVYLRKIHRVLAFIVLALTSFGTVAYISLLISAVISPDSPFQTPLAPLVSRLVPMSSWLKLRALFNRITPKLRGPFRRIRLALSLTFTVHAISCLILTHNSRVSWILETSTDPNMVLRAAEVAADLQWPATMDVVPQMNRLRESLITCFHYHQFAAGEFGLFDIREGMSVRAIQLGRAYHVLSCVNPSSNLNQDSRDFHWMGPALETANWFEPELKNVIRFLEGHIPLTIEGQDAIQWVLHVLPSLGYSPEHNLLCLGDFLAKVNDTVPRLDILSFTDYLFCVNTFLSGKPVNRNDAVWMNKSRFQATLFEHIFNSLISNLTTNKITVDIAVNIIRTTHRVASPAPPNGPWNIHADIRRSIVYQSCARLPYSDDWLRLVLATGRLTQHWEWGPLQPDPSAEDDAHWVHKALNSVIIPGDNQYQWDDDTEAGVAGLLLALHYYNTPPLKEHLPFILQNLLPPGGDISRNCVLLLLQENVVSWFEDDVVRPMLQNASVWPSLTRLVENEGGLSENYLFLGHTLQEIPDWEPHLCPELCSWISIFFRAHEWDLAYKYTAVLARLANPSTGGYTFADSAEEALGLTYTVLSNFWNTLDFSTPDSLQKSANWLDCSCLAVLRMGSEIYPVAKWEPRDVPTSAEFKEAFSSPLQESLFKAAAAAKRESLQSSSTGEGRAIAMEQLGSMLDDLAGKIPQPTDPDRDGKYWSTLQSRFLEEIGNFTFAHMAQLGQRARLDVDDN
ncbi:hypothetical protein MVEN_01582200 [Mycena venus]|uniref:DUF6535 domain-containing protein n=1 Tax=Mycena venus TaxID=2733690 RepID=A0A8H6XRX3_9AGAR|nr:hypothetical protein MVEN_01582200 [Mycena venus]